MGSRRVSFVVFASPKSGTQWIQQLLREFRFTSIGRLIEEGTLAAPPEANAA